MVQRRLETASLVSDRQGIDVAGAHGPQAVTQVPEVIDAAVVLDPGPGIPEAVMVPVVAGLDAGQDEAGRRAERVDVPAAGKNLPHAGGRGRLGVVVGQDGPPGAAYEGQGTAVVRCRHGRL